MAQFPSWHFREMDRGEINVDPVHDEFFKAQDLADALVREAIQNSLDARRGNSKVHVRFRFAVDDHALPTEAAARYLDGLNEHLPAGTNLPGSMPFLSVEDTGTRGLTGNPGEDPELDDTRGARNDFYYFWRNVGRSGKGELDRGRWGLGKAVFSVSSQIHTIFGLTLRADDQRRLLLGQSVLKTHILEGKRHAPYGFFANVGGDSFPHAIADEALIEQFVTDFGLQRSEPGLSIVIPFHRSEDLRFEQIVASVIRQYFYPILRSDLEVTVEENGIAEKISNRTIESVAKQAGLDESLARLCALTRTSVLLEEHEWIDITEPAGSAAPKWQDDAIVPERLEMLRQRFETGDVIGFRVALPVRRKKGRPSASHFRVVLQKDETLKRGEHHFIRRGITIPDVKSARDKPIRALLVADDDALSTFLGDAENPAHSDWSERNDRIRNLYENGASMLRYVKKAISHLATILATPPAGRNDDLLADLFSINLAADEIARGREPATSAAGETGETRVPGPRAPQPEKLRLTALAGGFTLRGSNSLGDVGAMITAEFAYRSRNGNPFRKHSRFDFDLEDGSLALRIEGATVRAAGANRMEIVPSRPDFHLTLTGFDARRDLVVRVTRRDDDAAEAELH
jgi:hypothetical protein